MAYYFESALGSTSFKHKLTQAGINNLGLELIGNSHFKEFARYLGTDSEELPHAYKLRKAKLRGELLPLNSDVSAFNGLLLAPKIYPPNSTDFRAITAKTAPAILKQVAQVADMQNILDVSPRKILLLQTTSNDYKYFMVREGRQLTFRQAYTIPVHEALNKQMKGMSEASLPPIPDTDIFTNSDLQFMRNQVRRYLGVLATMVARSGFEHVFIGTLLERLYPKDTQWMGLLSYFQVINHVFTSCIREINCPKHPARNSY